MGISPLFCTSQIVPDLLERFFMPNFAADLQMRFSAAPQQSSSKLDSAFGLHENSIPDDELLWALEGLIER